MVCVFKNLPSTVFKTQTAERSVETAFTIPNFLTKHPKLGRSFNCFSRQFDFPLKSPLRNRRQLAGRNQPMATAIFFLTF